METQYQRAKIQEESMIYERLKHSGELKIIGVNTFLSESGAIRGKIPLARSNPKEKNRRLQELLKFQKSRSKNAHQALKKLQEVSLAGGNIFGELMNTVKFCSLGQITNALYEVGGKYRRNM
jgi:methylmalonyl-CoA mutase